MDRQRLKWTALITAVVYAVVLILTFEPEPAEVSAKAFGQPFGLPTQVFVIVFFTLLYLPIPWFLWHSSRIIQYAARDKVVPYPFMLIRYFLKSDARHPELQTSKRICYVGMLYVIGVVASWIVYCSALGI
jgi:hypothetical protein